MTDQGAVDVTLDLASRAKLHDAFLSVPSTAWTPGTNVTVVTEHDRTDVRDASADVPAIESITLSFGTSPSVPLGEVIVDRLSEGSARFRQPAGAGLAAIQATSTASCTAVSCEVSWTFTSSWSFDDVPQLSWWTAATDADGLRTGPVVQAMGCKATMSKTTSKSSRSKSSTTAVEPCTIGRSRCGPSRSAPIEASRCVGNSGSRASRRSSSSRGCVHQRRVAQRELDGQRARRCGGERAIQWNLDHAPSGI